MSKGEWRKINLANCLLPLDHHCLFTFAHSPFTFQEFI